MCAWRQWHRWRRQQHAHLPTARASFSSQAGPESCLFRSTHSSYICGARSDAELSLSTSAGWPSLAGRQGASRGTARGSSCRRQHESKHQLASWWNWPSGMRMSYCFAFLQYRKFGPVKFTRKQREVARNRQRHGSARCSPRHPLHTSRPHTHVRVESVPYRWRLYRWDPRCGPGRRYRLHSMPQVR